MSYFFRFHLLFTNDWNEYLMTEREKNDGDKIPHNNLTQKIFQ